MSVRGHGQLHSPQVSFERRRAAPKRPGARVGKSAAWLQPVGAHVRSTGEHLLLLLLLLLLEECVPTPLLGGEAVCAGHAYWFTGPVKRPWPLRRFREVRRPDGTDTAVGFFVRSSGAAEVRRRHP